MTSPLALAAGAVGGLWLLTRPQGPLAHAGPADQAACDHLRQHGSLAGVDYVVPDNNSTHEAWSNFLLAAGTSNLTAALGAVPNLTHAQLYEILDTWIGAFAAGCNTSRDTSINWSLGQTTTGALGELAGLFGSSAGGVTLDTCSAGDCDAIDGKRSSIGDALCACAALRALFEPYIDGTNVDSTSFADASDVSETFDRVARLADEMDASDFVVAGMRASDNQVTVGGLAAGAVSAVESIPGKIAGGIADAIAGSSLFWVAVLGLVAWKVLR